MPVPILQRFCESCAWYAEADLCFCSPRRVLRLWLAAEGRGPDAEDWSYLQHDLARASGRSHKKPPPTCMTDMETLECLMHSIRWKGSRLDLRTGKVGQGWWSLLQRALAVRAHVGKLRNRKQTCPV